MSESYSIPAFPSARLRYYNNQFLKEQDFIDDQAFHISGQRAHLRTLFVGGVCEGLDVTYTAETNTVTVAPGSAVDRLGRLIVLAQLTQTSSIAGLPDGDQQLYVEHNEVAADPPAPSTPGTHDPTRWRQQPKLAIVPLGSVPDTGVVLCTLRIQKGALVGDLVRTGARQYSGLRLPGPSAVTLTNRNDGVSDSVQLDGRLTIRRSAATRVEPTLRLLTPASGGASAAIDFESYDTSGSSLRVRVQPFDDSHGSSHLTFWCKLPGMAATGIVERMRLTSSGALGIGTTTPQAQLHVVGDGRFEGNITISGTRTYMLGADAAGYHWIMAGGTTEGNNYIGLTRSGVVIGPGCGGNLSVGGTLSTATLRASADAFLNGNLIMPRRLIQLGTTDDTAAQPNEVVGAIGFLGLTRTHGQLAYRAGSGFELIDVSASAPQLGYAIGALPYADLTLRTITANALRGLNSRVLSTYKDFNPPSNVYLWSPPNDRDAWIYLDSAGVTANNGNWGIYHRQIDSEKDGLPGNSIAFVGGGQSQLRAYICLANGNASFTGNLTANSLSIGSEAQFQSMLKIVNAGDTSRFVTFWYIPTGWYGSTGRFQITHPNSLGQTLDDTGHWQPVSDASLKRDVRALEGVLDKVMRMRPVRFKWKHNDLEDSGLVAQDVAPLFPEYVGDMVNPETHETMKTLAYAKLSVLAIAALQEMKRDYDQRFARLERRLSPGGQP